MAVAALRVAGVEDGGGEGAAVVAAGAAAGAHPPSHCSSRDLDDRNRSEKSPSAVEFVRGSCGQEAESSERGAEGDRVSGWRISRDPQFLLPPFSF